SSAGAGPRARSQLPSPPLRRPPAPTLFPYTTLFRSLGVVPGGAGVPQPQRGEPVGVHVLRGALQLRERGDRAAALGRLVVLDLEEEGLVGLDDQWAVGHPIILPRGFRRPRGRSPPAITPRPSGRWTSPESSV